MLYVANDYYNNPKGHMHAHVYHEGVATKGAKKFCSLIMKTIEMNGLIKDSECSVVLS